MGVCMAGGHAWWGACMVRGVHGRGVCVAGRMCDRRACMAEGVHVAGETTTAAGGTHPT